VLVEKSTPAAGIEIQVFETCTATMFIVERLLGAAPPSKVLKKRLRRAEVKLCVSRWVKTAMAAAGLLIT
jgi:hypothetical protein